MQIAVSGADLQPGGQAAQHEGVPHSEEAGRGATPFSPTSDES